MKKIGIIGHFCFAKEIFNGQTIKTKIVAQELKKIYGISEVMTSDTHGGWRYLIRLPFSSFNVVRNCQNIIMMPARGGVRIIPFFLLFWNLFFHRRLHYVVIGGWLPELLDNHHILRGALKHFYRIYPETEFTASSLRKHGLKNLEVMPNFKSTTPLTEAELTRFRTDDGAQLPFCTFSRVIKAKGIEEAVAAISRANVSCGTNRFSLDIYGPIEEPLWFEQLMKSQPDYIRYKGIVPYTDSVATIRQYFALLFPTYYWGECFAGTLLDAFAAGVPVLASKWHSNPELVKDGEVGYLHDNHDVNQLAQQIIALSSDMDKHSQMQHNCLTHAQGFQPSSIITILSAHIK